MATGNIYIRLDQQQVQDNFFSYNINVDGEPLVYAPSGLTNVSKTFKQYIDVPAGRINKVSNTNALNSTFYGNMGSGFNGTVNKIVTATVSGATVYYAVGEFTSYNGTAKNLIARINQNGTLDTTFTLGTTPTGGSIKDIVIEKVTGNIFIVGDFFGSGLGYSCILKLSPSGAILNTFGGGVLAGVGNTTAATVAALANVNSVYVDDVSTKIYIGGRFDKAINGSGGSFASLTTRKNVARFNADGTLDTTFASNIHSGLTFNGTTPVMVGGEVFKLTMYNNIIHIGGKFTGIYRLYSGSYNNNNSKNYVQYNPATNVLFASSNMVNDTVRDIAFQTTQPQLGIILGGDFTQVLGSTRNKIARFVNNNLDATFVPFFGGNVLTITVNTSDAIFVGGQFDIVKSDAASTFEFEVDRIVKLFSTSGFDFTFGRRGYNDDVKTIALDGTSPVIGGKFTQYRGGTPVQSTTIIPIGTTLTDTVANTLANLQAYNQSSYVSYSSNTINTITATITWDDEDIFIDDIFEVTDVQDLEGYITIYLSNSNLGVLPIFAQTRSPHFIRNVDSGATSTKFELFIYKGGYVADQPALPQYQFTKPKIRIDQTTYYADVSPLTRDFLNVDINKYMTDLDLISIQDVGLNETAWFQLVTTPYTGSTSGVSTTTKYLAIDGFGYVEEGVNPQPPMVLMTNDEYNVWREGNNRIYFNKNGLNYIQVQFDDEIASESFTASGTVENSFTYISSIPMKYSSTAKSVTYEFHYNENAQVFTKKFNFIDECKFEPKEIYFKNKYGFLQPFPFFKRSDIILTLDSKTYNRSILTNEATYDPKNHSKVTYLANGRQTYTLNSGFIPEYMNTAYEELLLSDRLFMNDGGIIKPVNIVDKEWQMLEKLNQKTINYTLKVEVGQNRINDIR